MLLRDLASGHHTPTSAEFLLLFAGLRDALAAGGLCWVFYMALEPQVRRRSPDVLISWRRLLAGRLRDRLVGGHLLIGIALGVAALLVTQALLTPPLEAGILSSTGPPLPWSVGLVFGLWFWHAIVAVSGGLIYMFVLSLILMPVGPRWLALSIFVLLLALALTPYATGPVLAVERSIVFFGMVAVALARFGVLTAAAAIYAQITLLDFPLTTNWSAWYAQFALLAICTLLALAVYGAGTTLASRTPWPIKLDAN